MIDPPRRAARRNAALAPAALVALAAALAGCGARAEPAPSVASQARATRQSTEPAPTPPAQAAGGAAGAGGTAGGGDAAEASSEDEGCGSAISDAALAGPLKAAGEALARRDLAALAREVHPQKGVRFSAYGLIDQRRDVVLTPAQLAKAMADPKVRTWGEHDGTGAPIRLTFRGYFDRFVYDHDFVRVGRFARDKRLQFGNSINNVCEAYPGATYVEYHVPGRDPDRGGLDWATLRLVFAAEGGRVYLVGVVHDQWTI